MHNIEPYYHWLDLYNSETDELSPFYGIEHSEFEFNNHIYNYLIHPQWDAFSSETLYLKVLYADYQQQFCIIEFIGEWNDCIANDIMLLKTEVIDLMIHNGIHKFILIGENILNFHPMAEDYYEEWHNDVPYGWIAGIGFLEHVQHDFIQARLGQYIAFSDELQQVNWRKLMPNVLFDWVEKQVKPLLLH